MLIFQNFILQTTPPKSASPMEAGVDLQIITTACARWGHLLGISQDLSWAFFGHIWIQKFETDCIEILISGREAINMTMTQSATVAIWNFIPIHTSTFL